jgi:hypothetical protein
MTHDISDLSSERSPPKETRSNFGGGGGISGQKSQIGLDTKTYWLTDRQSQCDFDFDFDFDFTLTLVCSFDKWRVTLTGE